MEEKYDQTAKADAGKPDLTLVPLKIIWDIAKVREFGTQKYKERDNWKRVEIERYRAAAFRHLLRYLADPHGYDEESGLPHLSHLATNVAFLCAMETYKDRPADVQISCQEKLKKRCNRCKYYSGVHGVQGIAPCECPDTEKAITLWDGSCEYWCQYDGHIFGEDDT